MRKILIGNHGLRIFLQVSDFTSDPSIKWGHHAKKHISLLLGFLGLPNVKTTS